MDWHGGTTGVEAGVGFPRGPNGSHDSGPREEPEKVLLRACDGGSTRDSRRPRGASSRAAIAPARDEQSDL